jgi:hypothetical protein
MKSLAAGVLAAVVLLSGCAAAIGPISVRQELAGRRTPMRSAVGKPISGYFDGHGQYRTLHGRIRDHEGELQLRSGSLASHGWVTVSRDSVKTVMAARSTRGISSFVIYGLLAVTFAILQAAS